MPPKEHSLVDDENQSYADPTDTQSLADVRHLHDFMESVTAQRLMDIFAEGYCGLSLIVLTPDGTVVYANKGAVKALRGVDHNTVKGKHLRELTPPQWANERIKYMQQAVRTKKTVHMVDLLSGTRLWTPIRPVDIEHKGVIETLIFITVEPISTIQLESIRKRDPNLEIIMAEYVDLGRLNTLTSREIEVLALMGQGLRQKDIANMLCRSVSTIDRHRERIGIKLGITDRADLIAIAREAGLEVEDAKRTHMAMKPDLPKT